MLKPVVIADDHPLFRSALKQAVTKAAPEREIIETSSLGSTREVLTRVEPGLLCLDLHMEDSEGFAGMISMRHDYPMLPIAVISGSDTPEIIRRALNFGASGFIPKASELEMITEGITSILDGEIWKPDGIEIQADASQAEDEMAKRLASLTPAQLKVLTSVHEGLLNKQIAFNMGITEATVKAHLTAIFRKLDVLNRTQAVLAAASLFVDRDDPKKDA
ncbi:MAG: response regulator transcription factor [Aquisalinus sp.]|nr:response regulator transcription factor [Aquisalinus sp.]